MNFRPVSRVALNLGDRIDSLLSTIAPKFAYRRMQFRQAGRVLAASSLGRGARSSSGAWRGASTTRLNENWVSTGGSADEDLLWDLPTLRERSRELNRNDATAAGITKTMVSNVIGTGIKPQSRIDWGRIPLVTEEMAGAFQSDAERLFQQWAENESDATQVDGWGKLQQLAFRSFIENGEVILLRRNIKSKSRRFRLAWQLVESDRLDTPPGGDRKQIRGGVEIGANGEPVAYHVRKAHPGDYTSGGTARAQEFERIPARDSEGRPNVLHLYERDRVGQSRGVPFFAPVMAMFKELGDYIESEQVAARVAACFAGFIKTDNPFDAMTGVSEPSSDGRRLEALEPGMMDYLEPGEDVTFANPGRPNSEFPAFIDRVLRIIASGLGLPFELVAKDFSKVNYSSARAALLETRKMFRVWQDWFADKFIKPCWCLVLEESFLSDYWQVPDFYGYRYEYTKCRYVTPGWEWVDPIKEVNASTTAIESNLSTLSEECAKKGQDWEEVLTQRALEERRKRELGLGSVEQTGRPGRRLGPEDFDENEEQRRAEMGRLPKWARSAEWEPVSEDSRILMKRTAA